MRRSIIWPPSRLFVQSAAADCSIQSVCAWTLIRNAPGPKIDEASTTPVDSQEPSAPGVDASRPVVLPEPGRRGVRIRRANGELLARAGVLRDVEAVLRRLQVVGLVDLGE